MSYKTVFKRYELKYMITPEQKEEIILAMSPYMSIDEYGSSTVRNVYLDTDSYRLIRRSIEKPAFKEKIRLRSYSEVTGDGTVFVELKRKYDKTVYKRRIPLSQRAAVEWVCGNAPCPLTTQISREIDYFLKLYGRLIPSVFLTYEREAYYDKDGGDFRVTFDDNILCRNTDISLSSPIWGTKILPEEKVLMELKCSGGIPLWMTRVLSSEKIFKTSFSKYGTAYSKLIFPQIYLQTSKAQKEKITNGCNF